MPVGDRRETKGRDTGGRADVLRIAAAWTLIALGTLLTSVYLVGLVHARLGARFAAQAFVAQREAAGTPQRQPLPDPAPLPGDARVDFQLWDDVRIQGYKESLRHAFGTPLAVLRIPKIDLEVPVLEGTSELVLNRGVGWIEGTPRPGEAGNVGVAGHRDGFFRGLKDVTVGDRLVLSLPHEEVTYLIDEIRIVMPEDVYVLDARPNPSVTLVTCYPFYYFGSAPQRYIVHARREQSPASSKVP